MKYFVHNAGIIGNTLREIKERTADAAVLAGRGGVVVLLSGINDMLYPGHITTLDEYGENLRSVVGEIQNYGHGTVLAAVPAIDTEKYFAAYPDTPVMDPASALAAADCTVREVAAESACRIWDIRRVLGDNAAFRLEDGMHLSAAGALAAAEALAPIVRRLIPEGGDIVCLGDSLFYGPWLKGRGKAEPDGETIPSRLAFILNG